jgi:hypothetical protein
LTPILDNSNHFRIRIIAKTSVRIISNKKEQKILPQLIAIVKVSSNSKTKRKKKVKKNFFTFYGFLVEKRVVGN